MVQESKESRLPRFRARDKAVIIWISFLLLLSLDSIVFHVLPDLVSSARLPLICFLLLVPSRSANRITGIPELLVTYFSTIFVSIQLISSYISGDSPFVPPETFDEAIYKILSNIIFISLVLPWLWFAYSRFESKILQRILLVSTSVVYPIAILSQFSSKWSVLFYLFTIVFMSFWVVLSSVQIKIFYFSIRNRAANFIYLIGFLFLGTSFLLLLINRTSETLAIAQLAMDIWIYALYIQIALFSEGFILTKSQTLSAVRTYNRIKAKEETDCIVFANIDIYLRNIPEELLHQVDDDELTLAWIGLQRND